MVIKYSCTSPINFKANSVLKIQVFCAWSSFKISACTVPLTLDNALAFMVSYTSGGSTSLPDNPKSLNPNPSFPKGNPTVFLFKKSLKLLGACKAPSSVGFGEALYFGSSSISYLASIILFTSACKLFSMMYFSQLWSIAAFIKKAKSMGAGPLIVMLTDVLGSHKSKPLYNFFASSTVAMLTPLLPTLP